MKQLQEIFALFKDVKITKEDPTNLSIGGCGHLEHPISKYLAFYLNPAEAHGFNDLVLQSLLDTVDIRKSTVLEFPPLREVSTKNKKRIDLTLVGEDWVIAIELKVNHKLDNPFTEYDEYLDKTYRSGGTKKDIHRFILAPSEMSHGKWKPLTYRVLGSAIQEAHKQTIEKNIAPSKWDYFLSDFLKHITNFDRKVLMRKTDFDFTHDNIAELYQLGEIKKQFIKDVEGLILSLFSESHPDETFTVSKHEWREGPAFRIKSNKWKGDNGLIIETGFKTDTSTDTMAHIQTKNMEHSEILKVFSSFPIRTWENSNEKVKWYGHQDGFDSIYDAIEEAVKYVRILNQFSDKMSN